MIIKPSQVSNFKLIKVDQDNYTLSWIAKFGDTDIHPNVIDIENTDKHFIKGLSFYSTTTYNLHRLSNLGKYTPITGTKEYWDLFVEEYFPHLYLNLDDGYRDVYYSEYSALHQMFFIKREKIHSSVITETMVLLSNEIKNHGRNPLNINFSISERNISNQRKIIATKSIYDGMYESDWDVNYLRVKRNQSQILFDTVTQIYDRLTEVKVLQNIVACRVGQTDNVLTLPNPTIMDELISKYSEVYFYTGLTALSIFFDFDISLEKKEKLKNALNLPFLNALYPVIANEHRIHKELIEASCS